MLVGTYVWVCHAHTHALLACVLQHVQCVSVSVCCHSVCRSLCLYDSCVPFACLVNCCWLSPAQSYLVSSPIRPVANIFLSYNSETCVCMCVNLCVKICCLCLYVCAPVSIFMYACVFMSFYVRVDFLTFFVFVSILVCQSAYVTVYLPMHMPVQTCKWILTEWVLECAISAPCVMCVSLKVHVCVCFFVFICVSWCAYSCLVWQSVKLLLALSSTVVFISKFHGAHGHILLSQLW